MWITMSYFSPLFRVTSGVMSTLQPDSLVVYIVYINMHSAHLGSCSTPCGFLRQETLNSIKQCYSYFSALRERVDGNKI